MDAFENYMRESESALAAFAARLKAVELALAQRPGFTMEGDPSKLPVVVIENSQPSQEVASGGGN